MPKVIIWRDDAVETEFDPAHRDWRIGRSETNDIALLDPRKSVSRFHAELREENGQWFFIDLNSQNGSWKGGERVTRLRLEHDVEVSFGDYRLVFVDTPRVVPAAVPAAGLDTAATEVVGGVPPPVNPDETLLMPSARKDEAPTPPAGAPHVRPKAAPTAPRKGVNPVILVVFVIAMLGAVAAVGWRISQSMSDAEPQQPSPQATAPTPAPVPPPAEPEPVEADAVVAEDAAAEPPSEEPAVKEAAKTPVRSARPARRQAKPPAPTIPPEVEERYAAGRRALTAQRFPEAVQAFEAVLAALPGFRDTETLLGEARERESEARAQALADGGRLQDAGEWTAAVAAYERAGAAGAATAARTKMHAAGDDAYRKARQFDARARAADAIGWYERAVEWLPQQDARRQTARARLAELKGGVE